MMKPVTHDEVLEHLFDSESGTTWGMSLYPKTETSRHPDSELYLKDPDGLCWKITAERHAHDDDETEEEIEQLKSLGRAFKRLIAESSRLNYINANSETHWLTVNGSTNISPNEQALIQSIIEEES